MTLSLMVLASIRVRDDAIERATRDFGMRAKNSTNAVQNSHHELFYEARLAALRIRLALIIAYHRFINCPQ